MNSNIKQLKENYNKLTDAKKITQDSKRADWNNKRRSI